MHKLRNDELLQDNLKKQLLYMLSVKLSQNYVVLNETTYETIPMYLP